ncbi:MAG: hypothetical protein COV02_00145 [Candidatus Terrybacteria bacterium CG10_big_fil_rev_8_21_14_0_10_41_10]|uniref:Uncharacterized protein n=1 Tax=Candidatus Terrybacteria bacterium CG10_big_fil_rev_8_21_14_0_10_41_10 TaxID=1975026 RepID=A0A2M8LC14_9BACT|nr:MAG: hypothetical protein COV02_00145 [Candidatus Terrybacteria bacterium CG10_big_fil_rev_8_21_14_0_10_41_10]
MSKKNIVVLLLAIAVIIMAFIFLGKGDKSENLGDVKIDRNGIAQRITAKHLFENGVHTVAGDVDLPTPCHELTATATVLESFPEQVLIELKSKAGKGVCAQVVTPKKFKVVFNASKDASITAKLDGKDVILNLIRIGGAEDLDKDIFIKG